MKKLTLMLILACSPAIAQCDYSFNKDGVRVSQAFSAHGFTIFASNNKDKMNLVLSNPAMYGCVDRASRARLWIEGKPVDFPHDHLSSCEPSALVVINVSSELIGKSITRVEMFKSGNNLPTICYVPGGLISEMINCVK